MSIFRITVGTAITCVLAACQPADLPTESVRSRLESGQLVEKTDFGYRYKGCRDDMPDWSDLRLAEPERVRVVQGRQASIAQPGRRVCYRVGSIVNISVLNDSRRDLGRAQITRLAWIRLESLRAEHLRGRFFATPDAFYTYKDSLRARLSPRDQGLVTIVDFVYLSGSAVDEKTIIDGEKRQ